MNKILPNQPSWLASTRPMRPEQGQDFAEALHGRSVEEPKRPPSRAGRSVGTENFAKPGPPDDARETASAVESEIGDQERSTEFNGASALPDLMLKGVEAGTLSIGLLPEQVAWSRIYPEHLIASGYLSVVDTTEREVDAASEHVAQDGLEIAAKVSTATPVADGQAAAAKEATTSPSDPWLSSNAGFEDPAISSADAEVSSSPRVTNAIALADHIWAERLMRLTRHSDGEATVWLRDFALKESDLTPVVSRLVQRGRESGFRIGRVVINGREIWRAVYGEGGD